MPLYDLKPLQAAVAACEIAEPLREVEAGCNRSIGEFRMQSSGVQVTVDARRKKRYPYDIYLYVATIDNLGQQAQGIGTAFMHRIFDIADQTDIGVVTALANKVGRYAHAANYIQCHKDSWPALQEGLLEALDAYHEKTPAAHLAEAGRQAKLAEAVITGASGDLGPLVDSLRGEPNLGADAGHLPTLAKHLFLAPAQKRSYEGYWTAEDRMRARQAIRRKGSLKPGR